MKLEDFLVQKGIKESDLAAKTAEELAGIYNEYNTIKSEELEKAIEATDSLPAVVLRTFRRSARRQKQSDEK